MISSKQRLENLKAAFAEHDIPWPEMWIPTICPCGWIGRSGELIAKDVLRCPQCNAPSTTRGAP